MEAVIIAVVTSAASIILAIATLVQVLRVRSEQDAAARRINGRMDQLLQTTAKAGRAEGRAEERRDHDSGEIDRPKKGPAPPPWLGGGAGQ